MRKKKKAGHVASVVKLGWTDGRTHRYIMLVSHTLTMRGSDVASLVEFCPCGLGEMDGRRMHGRTDVRKINVSLAHPYHEGKWCLADFHPNTLGGDTLMDRWTDDGRTDGWTYGKIMLLSHTLTMRWNIVARLYMNSTQWFRRRQRDGEMDGRQMHEKIMLLLHTLTMRGSDVASLAEFRLVG